MTTLGGCWCHLLSGWKLLSIFWAVTQPQAVASSTQCGCEVGTNVMLVVNRWWRIDRRLMEGELHHLRDHMLQPHEDAQGLPEEGAGKHT